MDFGEMMRVGRIGMIELGRSLTAEEAEMVVPGSPEWTIRQVYAHQAGVVADALAGRLEGVTTDPWTARQVDERAEHTLTEILDEWEASAPAFEEFLANGGPPEVIVDQWTHEQDVRAALDRPGNRDDARAKFVVDAMASRFTGNWELEPLQIVGDRTTWSLGAGQPAVTLRASDFDLARLFLGRRSRAQVLALDWSGDPEPFVDALVVFTFATTDQPA